MTALHIKMRATGGTRPRAPVPAAVRAPRAVPPGLKIGRIEDVTPSPPTPRARRVVAAVAASKRRRVAISSVRAGGASRRVVNPRGEPSLSGCVCAGGGRRFRLCMDSPRASRAGWENAGRAPARTKRASFTRRRGTAAGKPRGRAPPATRPRHRRRHGRALRSRREPARFGLARRGGDGAWGALASACASRAASTRACWFPPFRSSPCFLSSAGAGRRASPNASPTALAFSSRFRLAARTTATRGSDGARLRERGAEPLALGAGLRPASRPRGGTPPPPPRRRAPQLASRARRRRRAATRSSLLRTRDAR